MDSRPVWKTGASCTKPWTTTGHPGARPRRSLRMRERPRSNPNEGCASDLRPICLTGAQPRHKWSPLVRLHCHHRPPPSDENTVVYRLAQSNQHAIAFSAAATTCLWSISCRFLPRAQRGAPRPGTTRFAGRSSARGLGMRMSTMACACEAQRPHAHCPLGSQTAPQTTPTQALLSAARATAGHGWITQDAETRPSHKATNRSGLHPRKTAKMDFERSERQQTPIDPRSQRC